MNNFQIQYTDIELESEINKLISEKNFEQAELICALNIAQIEKSDKLLIYYANIAVNNKDFSTAFKRYKLLREKFPNRVEGYYLAADLHIKNNEYEDAEHLCLKGIENSPNSPQSYVIYAETAVKQKNYEEALKRLDVVTSKFDKYPRGYFRKAWVYLTINQIDKAEQLCKYGMEKYPTINDFAIIYAECAMSDKRYEDALERWDYVINKYPNFAHGYYRKSIVLLELFKIKEAEELCVQCIKNFDNVKEFYIVYAECAMRERIFYTAVDRWLETQKKFPDLAKAYIREAHAYLNLNDYKKALTISDFCINNFNNEYEFYRIKVECLIKQGKYDNALLLINNFFIMTNDFSNIKLFPFYLQLVDLLANKNNNPESPLQFILFLFSIDPFYRNNKYLTQKFYIYSRDYLFSYSNSDNFDFNLLQAIIIYYFIIPEFINGGTIFLFIYYSLRINLKLNFVLNLINKSIKKYRIKNDLTILFSNDTDKTTKESAIYNLFLNSCHFIAKFLNIRPEYHELINSVLNIIIKQNKYLQFNDTSLFNLLHFTKFFNFTHYKYILDNYNSNDTISLSTFSGLINYINTNINKSDIINSNIYAIKKQKLNVAICICGQLRGYKQSFTSLYNIFDLSNHKVNIFVHTWKNIGRKFPIIDHAMRVFNGNFLDAYIYVFNAKPILEIIATHYPNLNDLLSRSKDVSKNELKNFYNTPYVYIEDDNKEPFVDFSNQKKMQYKKFRCIQQANQFSFDIIIYLRPDLLFFSNKQYSLLDIYRSSNFKSSLFINNGYGMAISSYTGFRLDESIMLGNQELMTLYSNTYTDFINLYWKSNALCAPSIFSGHTSNQYQILVNGINIEALNDIKYNFTDPDKIPISEIYQALLSDTANRTLTPDDKILLDACRKDLDNLT